MQYYLVYDAAQSGYRCFWFPLAGLALVVIIHFIEVSRERNPNYKNSFRYRLNKFGLWFGVLWVVIVFAGTGYEYMKLSYALRTGRYSVVEGRVTQFVPMPREGHMNESFVVNGRRYEYSDYGISAGFNNTSAHGGPIRPGLQVRIADVSGKIARLEILPYTEDTP